MKLGFNSNVEVGGAVYHVQTEDRGLLHPFVDTVVLSGGRVVHRRSASYQDLLSETELNEAALRTRVERQHREIVDELRDGHLVIDCPPPSGMALRLCNPASWFADGHASLEVEVLSDPEKRPLSGVDVIASIEGREGLELARFAAQTAADGRARLRFRMPDLADSQSPFLLISLAPGGTEPSLRYRLKPKLPATASPAP